MNRKTAKLIRGLARISGRSQRLLKKEYYALGDKDRYEMKKEIAMVIAKPGLLIDEASGIPDMGTEENIENVEDKI